MRRLTLRSEALAALTHEELEDVVGGATATCPSHDVCVSRMGTLCYVCDIGSVTEPCITVRTCTT